MPLDANRPPWRSWPCLCSDGVTRQMKKTKRLLPNGDHLLTCYDDDSLWVVTITGAPHIAEPYLSEEDAGE